MSRFQISGEIWARRCLKRAGSRRPMPARMWSSFRFRHGWDVRFGRKNYFVFSLVGFVVASVLCGLAPNLNVLIMARVLQGLAGGGLAGQGTVAGLRNIRRLGTGRGAGHFRPGRDCRAGGRSGARRLADGHARLALDFLHQYPLRHPCGDGLPHISARGRAGEARQERACGLDGNRSPGRGPGLFPDDAGGRTAGRLVQLPASSPRWR